MKNKETEENLKKRALISFKKNYYHIKICILNVQIFILSIKGSVSVLKMSMCNLKEAVLTIDFELIFKKNVSKDMKHMCEMYWESYNGKTFDHKVSEIGKKYNISPREVTQKVRECCVVVSPQYTCNECQLSPKEFKSRTDFTSNRTYWICNDCTIKREEQQRKDDLEFRAGERQKEAIKADQIRKSFEYKLTLDQGSEIQSLSLRQAVYLLSLIRCCGSDDLSYIEP